MKNFEVLPFLFITFFFSLFFSSVAFFLSFSSDGKVDVGERGFVEAGFGGVDVAGLHLFGDGGLVEQAVGPITTLPHSSVRYETTPRSPMLSVTSNW